MKSRTKLAAAAVVLAVAFGTLLGLWRWQATKAERLFSFDVPNWVMCETNQNVSYSVAIHKSQVRPYWTLWKSTFYPKQQAQPR